MRSEFASYCEKVRYMSEAMSHKLSKEARRVLSLLQVFLESDEIVFRDESASPGEGMQELIDAGFVKPVDVYPDGETGQKYVCYTIKSAEKEVEMTREDPHTFPYPFGPVPAIEEQTSTNQPDTTRTVAIEHAGEKIHIEVHIHLSKEERRQLAQVVMAEMVKQLRMQSRPLGEMF